MYLNFIQHDWRKYYNISKASTWLQNKSNGIAQERKSKFQFLSDLIYVLLFYVCFSFYNFFFYFVRIKNVVLLRQRIKKKFYRFIFRLLLYFLFDIWIYSEMFSLFFSFFYSGSYDGWSFGFVTLFGLSVYTLSRRGIIRLPPKYMKIKINYSICYWRTLIDRDAFISKILSNNVPSEESVIHYLKILEMAITFHCNSQIQCVRFRYKIERWIIFALECQTLSVLNTSIFVTVTIFHVTIVLFSVAGFMFGEMFSHIDFYFYELWQNFPIASLNI